MSTPNGWHRRNPNSPAAQARKKQYNSTEYRRARANAARQVRAGHASCWRCGTPLAPDQPFHLGHDDHDRSIIRGPECVTCNLGAAARAGAAAANTQPSPRRRTRAW